MPQYALLLAATVAQGAAAFSHGSSAGNSLGFATWSSGSLSASPLALTNKGGSIACRGGRAGAASPLMMAGGFGKQTGGHDRSANRTLLSPPHDEIRRLTRWPISEFFASRRGAQGRHES
jgi:hypothetical protein